MVQHNNQPIKMESKGMGPRILRLEECWGRYCFRESRFSIAQTHDRRPTATSTFSTVPRMILSHQWRGQWRKDLSTGAAIWLLCGMLLEWRKTVDLLSRGAVVSLLFRWSMVRNRRRGRTYAVDKIIVLVLVVFSVYLRT